MPQIYPNLSVEELDVGKLTPRLKLSYNNALNDAMADLGDAVQLRKAFVGFQRCLYEGNRYPQAVFHTRPAPPNPDEK